jgi:hypothetical protein
VRIGNVRTEQGRRVRRQVDAVGGRRKGSPRRRAPSTHRPHAAFKPSARLPFASRMPVACQWSEGGRSRKAAWKVACGRRAASRGWRLSTRRRAGGERRADARQWETCARTCSRQTGANWYTLTKNRNRPAACGSSHYDRGTAGALQLAGPFLTPGGSSRHDSPAPDSAMAPVQWLRLSSRLRARLKSITESARWTLNWLGRRLGHQAVLPGRASASTTIRFSN